MKMTQAAQAETQKVAIIGLPGSGKTTLAAALAAAGFRLHWIDIERGSSVLYKLSTEAQDNIDLIRLPDSASYPIAADTLTQLFKVGKAKICHAHGKVDCQICKKSAPEAFDHIDFSLLDIKDIVVVDSGTQWSNSILAHVMKGRAMDAKPERDDWGALRKHTEFALSQIQAANFNLIVIFHAQEAEMENGAKKLVPTFGSASMSTEVAKAFDHVVYCDIRNRKHVAFSSTTALPNVMTKSRLDFEIEKLAVPSLAPIFDGSIVKKNHAAVLVSMDTATGEDKTTLATYADVVEADKQKVEEINKELIKGTEIAAGITEFNPLNAASNKQADTRTPGQRALDNLRNKK